MSSVSVQDSLPCPEARFWSELEWHAYHKRRQNRMRGPIQRTQARGATIYGKPIGPEKPQGITIYDFPIGPMRFIFTAAIEEVYPSLKAEDLGPHIADGTPIEWSELVRYVCRKHQITPIQLKSERRQANLVLARHELWYLGRRHTTLSYPQMAHYCGGRDHTSGMWGVKKYQSLLNQGVVDLLGSVPQRPL